MKTIQISDELHIKLKNFVVDPFDDTPDSVIRRLIEIADKAKGKWTAWEVEAEQTQKQAPPQNKQSQQRQEKHKEPAENLSYL
jgi:hypothetical protein